MIPQSFFDALAAVLYPALAGVHFLIGCLAILRIRQLRYPRYWYIIASYFLTLSATFAALSLSFGPPALLSDVVARNANRVILSFVLLEATAFVALYLIEQFTPPK